MTPDLPRLLALCDAATPGERAFRADPFDNGTPYFHIAAGKGFYDDEGQGFDITGIMSDADAELASIAPETVAALIRRLIAAEAVVEAAQIWIGSSIVKPTTNMTLGQAVSQYRATLAESGKESGA